MCCICAKGVVFYNMAQCGLLLQQVSIVNTESSI